MASSKNKSIEEIEELAVEGKDITSHFKKAGEWRGPIEGPFVKRRTKVKYEVKKINIDLTAPILDELDEIAALLNISRQAVIKNYIKDGLDKHHRARTSTTE